MPKVYQAHFSKKGSKHRHHSTSKTKILAEARAVARETGNKIDVDVLEMEVPSMKYFIELLNGAKPKSRERLCSFVPKGAPVVEVKDGVSKKLWKVKKVS